MIMGIGQRMKFSAIRGYRRQKQNFDSNECNAYNEGELIRMTQPSLSVSTEALGLCVGGPNRGLVYRCSARV